jgi:hypothetical protein
MNSEFFPQEVAWLYSDFPTHEHWNVSTDKKVDAITFCCKKNAVLKGIITAHGYNCETEIL